MPAEVFISYARRDRDQVLPWVTHLQEAGVSLWLDERDIDAAHLWTREIVDALRACTVLLLMLSPASAASEQVLREVTLALEEHKRILPLLLEPVEIPATLRYPLAGLQQIELFHGEPEAKRTALLRALTRLGVSAPGWETVSPPTAGGEPQSTSSRSQHNLPRSLTRFIGREQQVAEATARLATTPLLTLTGTGGLGKTRLALQVATDVLPDYLDGVWLVELAALAEPTLVPQQVATALGVREEPGRALVETLTEYLQPRQLLLVLDNCEHLVGACAALVQRLLQACPDLRILATSREALGVSGEALFRVPTLATPIPPPPPVEQLTQYEAVRLFIDRALLSQPAFAVTNANAPAVAEVCHRLDGIPLALELAAARVKALPVEQIARRLDDRFRLLAGGSRTALPRQQTLRALIDWSYDLLSEPERVLLGRLSVFAGGFGLEAAEAICAGEKIEDWEVLDLLTALVEKSLVQYEEREGAGRYRLLETIRQYGAEKLAAAGNEAGLRERHRDWYLALAEQASPELQGPQQGEWLTRLDEEHENLRAALAWCTQRGEGEKGLRLGGALWRFWMVRGYLTEGREWLTRLLALSEGAERTAARAKVQNGAAGLALQQGDYAEARALFEASLTIRRELGDPREIANSLINLGVVSEYEGDYPAARSLYEESLAMKRGLGDRLGIATALINLGNVSQVLGEDKAARSHYQEALAIWRELGDQGAIAACVTNLGELARFQGDYAAARALYEESLVLRRELGDRQGVAQLLDNLGDVARHQEDYESAQALFEESLRIDQELGNKRGIAYSLTNLGCLAHHRKDETTARALILESLTILKELGDRHGVAYALEALASVGIAQGQPELAARLFAAADTLRQALGTLLSPCERGDLDHDLATVRAWLGEAAFGAAWAEGKGMSLEELLAQGANFVPSQTL